MKLADLAWPLAALVLTTDARHGHQHAAVGLSRRPAGLASPIDVVASATSSAPAILTFITPSPGASPLAVTQQSQIVTSYTPQFTLCELPPIEFVPVIATPVPSAKAASTARYSNYSISIPPGNGSCTTIYSATETMVCATTLTGLASKIPITDCVQDVTFSSQYGYTLITPTPTLEANMSANATTSNAALATITPPPSIKTLTTFFVAPWWQLTAGTAPSNVVRAVCSAISNTSYAGEECITAYQVWRTSLVTYMATSTRSLNVSTTIHGPSQVLVESFVANITERLTTFSFSTTLESEYVTHYTTTQRSAVVASTGPTVFETLSVKYASSTPRVTSTTTISITRTIIGGTTTVYPTPLSLSPDLAVTTLVPGAVS